MTSPPAAAQIDSISAKAKSRLHAHRFEPLFVADWQQAVFFHFAVDPNLLAPQVPFPLDSRDGSAWVSLVAFTMRGMRLRAAGSVLGSALLRPIATSAFLNARTYVVAHDEPGIYFLAEWLSNRLAVTLGPATFGLPYRHGRLDYRHDIAPGGRVRGIVARGSGAALRYSAAIDDDAPFSPCEPGSLDAFLLERYTAFVAWPLIRKRGFFRVWHEPWPQIALDAEVDGAAELFAEIRGGSKWGKSASLAGANASPGAAEVALGRPHLLP